MRRSIATAGALGAWLGATPANAEPPPSDHDKVTAPMPDGARRGFPPPPRLLDRFVADGPADDTAQKLGLVRQTDGSFLYLDPRRRFTARFEPDGRVQFADRWRRPASNNRQRGVCCGRPPEGFAAGLNPFWGAPVQGPLEWIMRGTGHDPAGAAKAAFLAKTRAFRTRLAVGWHLDLIRRRLEALDGELVALWGDREIPLVVRKRLLFQRWDECTERFDMRMTGIPHDAIVRIDEARTDAGMRARAKIETFVRRHAPARSPRAFTRTQLERLNAQRVSVRRFDPYAAHKEETTR
jgi:hypothetical protein